MSDTFSPMTWKFTQLALLSLRQRGSHHHAESIGMSVLVKNGEIVGKGFHLVLVTPWAERMALAGCRCEKAKGATAYWTLEPLFSLWTYTALRH